MKAEEWASEEPAGRSCHRAERGNFFFLEILMVANDRHPMWISKSQKENVLVPIADGTAGSRCLNDVRNLSPSCGSCVFALF